MKNWGYEIISYVFFICVCVQEVCLNGILELIGNWISQSPYHVVWLNCKAAYGYEYLFTNLGEEFNTQVTQTHISVFSMQRLPKAQLNVFLFCCLILLSDPREESDYVQEDAGDPELRDDRPQDTDPRLSTPQGQTLCLSRLLRVCLSIYTYCKLKWEKSFVGSFTEPWFVCFCAQEEEFFQGSRLPCGCTASDGTPLRIISIKPSTMWFGERTRKTNVIIK